ncbi:MAG: PAS domain S-box protein, partial [Rhodospirillaceae bacterium]|nr:PAS domain S-box protein [Rhodospirillaceae bacterium]
IFAGSGSTDEKGLNILSLHPGLEAIFNHALDGKQGDVFVSEATELDSGLGVAFLTPITDESNTIVIKILLTEVNLDVVRKIISDFDERIIGDKYVYLVDNDGRVIISDDPNVETFDPFPDLAVNPELLEDFSTQGQNGSIIYTDAAGDEVMAGFADMDEFGVNQALDWSIIAVAPLADITAPIQKFKHVLLIFTVVISLLAVFFMFLSSNRISRSVQSLVKGAKEVGTGNLDFRIESGRNDEFSYLANTFNDTAHKLAAARIETKKNTKKLQSILDTAVDGIITIDRKGTVLSFNRRSQVLFGYFSTEVIGKNIKMLMPDPYQSEHDGYLSNFMDSGKKKIIGIGREVQGLRKDGHVFPMDLAVSEVKVGDDITFTGIVRDISERKEIDQMKDQLISTVSHELRTPLTVILGYLPFLTNPEKLPAPEMVADFARKIEVSGKHLLEMLNDLLDISKLEEGKFNLNTGLLDPSKIVREVSAQLAPKAREKNLEIVVTAENCIIEADPVRLRQILINLMGNAIKFTNTGHITIILSVDHNNNEAVFSVTDSGVGLTTEDQEKIFDRFKQADSTSTRSAEGTGLGLAISKSLVELHGGKIAVFSIENVGSTFIFSLPIKSEGASNG